MPTVFYKRATFVTHLPDAYRFTHSHCWLSRVDDTANQWRVGYTKFALRMLGEIVDLQLERRSGDPIVPGDVLGSIEGFKALSDIFCVAEGRFVSGNPALESTLDAISESPYDRGWIYQFEGSPEARSLDVKDYCNLLDATIDRMLEKQQQSK